MMIKAVPTRMHGEAGVPFLRRVEQNFGRNSIEKDDSSSIRSDYSDWETSSDGGEQSDSATSYDGENMQDDEEDLLDLEELAQMRFDSVQKLRSSWEYIINRYGTRSCQSNNTDSNFESQISKTIGFNPNIPPVQLLQPWKSAHTIVPPLARFQGSSGIMIAPEWQILPIEETGEEIEDEGEDVVDFGSQDWENDIQNTSYFGSLSEKAVKIDSSKNSPVFTENDVEASREKNITVFREILSSPRKAKEKRHIERSESKKRQMREHEEDCEISDLKRTHKKEKIEEKDKTMSFARSKSTYKQIFHLSKTTTVSFLYHRKVKEIEFFLLSRSR